jgi:hypothetical protein
MRKTYIGILDLSKMRIMHHDLNTPINPILQYSGTILSPESAIYDLAS